nr:hypothetical protein GCM10020093_015300 [Planobispora longispora]
MGVAMATASKVLAELRRRELVRAVPGVGTVVAAPAVPSVPVPAPTARRDRSGGPVTARNGGDEDEREGVVRAAVRIADAEGIAALSMRRLATELGVATMSLYRHVRDKDELVLLMTDLAYGEDELPDPPPRAGAPSWSSSPACSGSSTAATPGWRRSPPSPARCWCPTRWPTPSGRCARSPGSASTRTRRCTSAPS